MSAARNRQGQPIIALVLVLGGWIGLRTASWDASALTTPGGPRLLPEIAGSSAGGTGVTGRAGGAPPGAAPAPASPQGAYYSSWPEAMMPGAVIYREFYPGQFAPGAMREAPGVDRRGLAAPPAAADGGWFHFDLASGAGGRLAGDAVADGSTQGSHPFPGGNAAPGTPGMGGNGNGGGEPSARHWSGDAWALLRGENPGPLANGAAPASYGASQSGAVLRYGFAPASSHRPAIYARASTALGELSEYEGALGLQARPLAALPVIVAGELRANHGAAGTVLRPAGFAYTQLPRFGLPLATRGEAYLQGGYVGGADATLFIDGQVRVDRSLGTYRRSPVRIGGGVWGGAQSGAARLDLGPGATLDLPLRPTISARIAVDYRLRVAGDAEPGSGPALTVSAGF